jgi:hypothetical protein
MENLNLNKTVLFYLLKLLQSGDKKMAITLAQLQQDITVMNNLLDAINQVFPNTTENMIVTFIEAIDGNPILQNIILLVVNDLIPTPAPTPAPAPAPSPAPSVLPHK